MNQITLATLPQATPEQVFEQIARHLLKQWQKSVSPDSNRCAYRGALGMSCAAGCLISDDEYDLRWEARSWTSLALSQEVPADYSTLIRRLQVIHDSYPVLDWPSQLRQAAGAYNIELSPELRDLLNSYGD